MYIIIFVGGLLIIIILVAVFLIFMVKTRRMQNPIDRIRSMSTKSAGPFIQNNFDSVTKKPNDSLSKSYNVSQ